jgi:hypothetical protein
VDGGFRISGDESKFFCIIWQSLQVWSIQTGEVVSSIEVGVSFLYEPLHVDGSRVWVSYYDKPTQGWDFGVPGPSPVPLSSTSLERPHLHLICSINCSGETDGPVWIEDTVTGKEVLGLSGDMQNLLEHNGMGSIWLLATNLERC